MGVISGFLQAPAHGIPTRVPSGVGISITCDVDHAGHASLLLMCRGSALSGWEIDQ